MKKLLSCLTAFVLVLLLSCERKSSDIDLIATSQSDNLVIAARQYFEANLVYNDKSARQVEPTDWRKKKQPQWDKAIKTKVGGADVVEVPLLVDGQEPVYTLDNPAFGERGVVKKKNGVTKALFFKQKDGTIKEYVLKLILEEEYLNSNINYKNLSISALSKGFSGFAIISDWNDKSLDQYYLEKGKVVATTRNDFSNSPNARAASCQPICQNVCVGMSMPCCSMSSDQSSYCCTNTYMSCHPQCFYLCIPNPPIVQPNPPAPGTGNGTANTVSSQAFMANYKLIGPIKPINIANKLNCFGTVSDNSKFKYSVTLYIDQPVDGTRNIANFSLSEVARRPGHTYLGFERVDTQTGEVIRLVAGYYVQSELTAAMNIATPGAWGDDGGTSYDVSLRINVSPNTFKDVIYNIKNLGTPMYHIVDNNCTTFAYNVVQNILSLPEGKGSFGPLGVGRTPADLGQDLRERQSSYGDKMTLSNGSSSPQSTNCN